MENLKYNFALNIHHTTVTGRFITIAKNERGAIRNVVFRELQNRNRATRDVRPLALRIASDIYEKHLYRVEYRNPILPSSGPSTQRLHDIEEPEPEDLSRDSEFDSEIPPVRRGDQEYPENPDDEDRDDG